MQRHQRNKKQSLTHLACVNARPENMAYKISDRDGLYLYISKSGSKSFRYNYKFFKKHRTITYGRFPEVSLNEARELHAKSKRLISQNKDPVTERKKTKQIAEQETNNTLGCIADQWFLKFIRDVKEVTYLKNKRIWDLNVPHEIKQRPIKEITKYDVIIVIEEIERRDALEIANRTFSLINRIFRYASARDYIEYNFIKDLSDTFEKKKVRHFPAITNDRIFELLSDIQKNRHLLTEQTVDALLLLMLTFVRPIELVGAKWEEFDFEDLSWTIPRDRMKLKRPHIVPLSEQSTEILKKLKLENLNSAYIFPNARTLRKHMARDTLSKATRILGYQNIQTPHGFRATARTLIREKLKYPEDVIERQLAHKASGSLGEAYDRTQFLADRRIMMQDWADFLMPPIKKE